MRSHTPLMLAGLIWLLASCMITAPTADGEYAFRGEAWPTAEAEFAPLAEAGDATAQFYMVVMSLRGLLATPLSDDAQRSYLISSASGGELRALGLMVWLSANTEQRGEWLEAYRTGWAEVHTINDDGDILEQLRALGVMDRVLLAPMEELIDGPLSPGTFSNLFPMITPQTEDSFLSASLAFTDADFLAVDQALARDKNKEAQTRLALRHQTGRGVEKDPKRSIRLLRAAASNTPAPRNCFYQAQVGDTPASVQCFGQGAATPGNPRAQWELCQIYAFGRDTEQDEGKAEFWCNRAMRDPRYRTLARDTLIEMAPPPSSE
ncbi:MAG: hypothetical protein AAFR65_01210 [Pseudomonadota bacterium]